MALAREALRTEPLDLLVPEVYWWHGENDGAEAMLVMEYKPGVQLSEVLGDASALNMPLEGFPLGSRTPSNVLIDPQTHQLTALLDFDFAYIGGQLDPYFALLPIPGSSLSIESPGEDEPGATSTQQAVLTGYRNDTSTDELARDFSSALDQAKAVLPSHVSQSADFAAIIRFSELLCPFHICNEIVASTRTAEQRRADLHAASGRIERAFGRLPTR